MCGIVGIQGLEDRSLLKAMMDCISHRGPDDRGEYSDDGIMFGHLRLSIIDLSTGRQPISNEDGSVVTVFNGEIYNWRGIREGLERRGHRFATNTDTEVIVHLYEEMGPDFVNELRGMFAIALWDGRQKRLVLARDRIGIKPLYYHESGGILVFASEVKALLEYGGLKRRLNRRAADCYLTLQYVPGPSTALEGVMKLEPGHVLVRDALGTRVRRYWDLRADYRNVTESRCLAEVEALLTDCVRMRLMSDVPLGAYLSGGLDSSAMVALMSSMTDEPVKTFSIGFGYDDVDEVKHASVVAEHFGTDHHELIADSGMAVKSVEDVVWHLDEPIGDPAALPTYLLSRKAKEKVSVILTGEGGDEAFAGYRTYKLLSAGDALRDMMPAVIRENVVPLAIRSVPGFTRAKRYMRYVSAGEDAKVYLGQGHVFDEEERISHYSDGFRRELAGSDSLASMRGHFNARTVPTFLSRLQYVDLKSWVPDDLLMKLDKTTMAWAVEGRVPFLDHVLLEYAMSLPPCMKLRGTQVKYILRRMMVDRLPKTILARKKQGFRVPTHHWMGGELREYALNVLSEKTVRRRGILRPDKVAKLLENPDNIWRGHQIWALLTLELWQRMYVDGVKPTECI